MKQLGVLGLGAAALVLLSCAAAFAQVPRDRPTPPAGPAPAGTSIIAGRMTSPSTTGTPVPVRRARVTLESSALRAPMTTDTDTEGRYRFTNLPAGSFRIRGEKAGFVPRIADPRRAFELPPLFDVTAGQSVMMDLPMQAGAALEGRILKTNGDPASGVLVSAVRMSYDVNGRRPSSIRQVKADDLGRFRVHTLPAGEYQIDAAPDPIDVARQAPVPGARPPVPSRTYYPGAARFNEARIVAVSVGQTASNLDFAMTAVPMAQVRGKVSTADGNPANGAAVRLQRVGGPVGEVRGSSSIETNDFVYSAVPAGDYWMMALARPAPGADPEYSVTRLSFDGSDLSNIMLTTARHAPVTGRIEGVALAPGLQVVASETAFEWPGLNGEPPNPKRWVAPVGADGTFLFSALPGPRLLRVDGLPAGVAIKQILLGEADVTDIPFEVRSGDAPLPIRIVLTADTAAVSGVVKDGAGKPAAGARVVLFSDDEKLWGSRSRMVATTETKADGSYQLSGVLPGAYRIVAASFMEALSWTDTAVLYQLKSSADAATITLGKTTVNLVVK